MNTINEMKKWRVTYRATQSDGSGQVHNIVVEAADVLGATLAAGNRLRELCPNAYVKNPDYQSVKALLV